MTPGYETRAGTVPPLNGSAMSNEKSDSLNVFDFFNRSLYNSKYPIPAGPLTKFRQTKALLSL